MAKEVAPITTVNISVTKPEKREAMPLSAPVSLDNRKINIYYMYGAANPSFGRRKRDDMVAASLMNPLGATSLVWRCTISHPVRDALILTAKEEGHRQSEIVIVCPPVKQKKANILSGVTQSKARWRGMATIFTRIPTETPGIQPTTNDPCIYNNR